MLVAAVTPPSDHAPSAWLRVGYGPSLGSHLLSPDLNKDYEREAACEPEPMLIPTGLPESP